MNGKVYFMLTTCQKNRERLDYYREFIRNHTQDFNFYNVEFLFMMGGTPDSSLEDVIFLDVSDEYEHLPKKVFEGIKYIYDSKPDVECIIKIDDDVKLTAFCVYAARYISWIPYWGVKIGHLLDESTVYHEYYERFAEKNLEVVPLKKCVHAIGHVYSLNRHSIELILKNREAMYAGYHEDAIVGRILNEHNIFPVDFSYRLEREFTL